MIKIINTTNCTTFAEQCKIADSFWLRLRGLLFTDSLPSGHGLLIKPCNSVHTIWMSYPIDVIFLDAGDNIIKAISDLKPMRFAACIGSAYVVELPAGTLARTATQAGDKVVISSPR